MCNYCEGENEMRRAVISWSDDNSQISVMTHGKSYLRVIVRRPHHTRACNYTSHLRDFDINFCPMCGRKFKEDNG